MIAVLIFFAHTIFAVYAFCRSYQNEGIVQAFLNVAFIIILFAVGWTVSDFFLGFFIADSYNIAMPDSNFEYALLKMSGFFIPGNGTGTLVPKDTLSLIVLTVLEIFFYRFYFKNINVTPKNTVIEQP